MKFLSVNKVCMKLLAVKASHNTGNILSNLVNLAFPLNRRALFNNETHT